MTAKRDSPQYPTSFIHYALQLCKLKDSGSQTMVQGTTGGGTSTLSGGVMLKITKMVRVNRYCRLLY